MKKKLKFCIVITAIAVLCLSLAACNTLTEKYYSSISEIRDAVYEGAGDGYTVTIVSGVHEQPFKPDGAVGEKTDFTVITLKPDEFMPGSLYTYNIAINGESYSGLLSMHPFGESYSAEIPARTHESALSLSIRYSGKDETVELIGVLTENDITADNALETALSALESDLSDKRRGNAFDCEIYIRFIPNPINADGGYYWYVAFVSEDSALAVLLDRATGDVVGIKN